MPRNLREKTRSHLHPLSNTSTPLSSAMIKVNRSPTPWKPSNLLKPTGRRSAKTRNGRLARSSFSCSRTRSASRSALIRLVLFSFFFSPACSIRPVSLRDAEELNRVEDHAGNAFKYGGPWQRNIVEELTRWPGGRT